MAYLSTNPTDSFTQKVSAEQIRFEEEAYFELSKIINAAMQNKDLVAFESALSAWLISYDIDSFVCASYKEKIKALLSTVASLKKTLIEFAAKQPNFDLSRAYQKLYHIIRETKDITELKSKIKEWKLKYPPDKFNDYFKPKIKQITSDAHLKRIAFDQKEAFNELQIILDFGDDLYIEDLTNKVDEWKSKYNINDFINKYSYDVNQLTDNQHLFSISKKRDSIEDIENIVQETAYADLVKALANPKNVNGIFNWVYRYRNVSFNGTARNLLCKEFLKYYNIPKYDRYQISNISDDFSLSYDTFKNLSSIKKDAIINYFGLMLYGDSLSSNNRGDLENLYSFSSCGIEISLSEKTTVDIPKEKTEIAQQEASNSTILSGNDILNLEKIHSANEEAKQLKKVDSFAKDVLKKQPEISNMNFEVSTTASTESVIEIETDNNEDINYSIFSSFTLSTNDDKILSLIIRDPPKKGEFKKNILKK